MRVARGVGERAMSLPVWGHQELEGLRLPGWGIEAWWAGALVG